MTEKKAKAYIIGDADEGMTIVITNPVMVVHYSAQDLVDAGIGDNTRAAIVRHLLPQLRGVDVPKMMQFANELGTGSHGDKSLNEEANYLREVNFAETVAQHVATGSGVFDVDFCISLDVDACDLVVRGRFANPGTEIGSYLDKYSGCHDDVEQPESVPVTPQKFEISGISGNGLGSKPPRWNP